MLPEATISHHTARRLRIHIPQRKRNPAFFAKIRDELAKLEGVERVEANPSTGSVLIHHRSSVGAIAQFAETAKLFALAVEGAPLNPTSLASRINENVRKLNKQLVAATHGTLDLTSVTAFGLAVGGVLKGIVCKDFLPSGGNMVWWAASLLARHDVRTHTAAVTRGREREHVEREAPRRKRIRRARR